MTKKPNFSVFFKLGIAAERNLFQEGTGTYDGIAISAYYAAFYRTSTPVLMRGLNKPFFFDPATFAFARDIENIRRDGDLRKSFQKLVDWYGSDVKQILTRRQLIPRDFVHDRQWNTKRLSEFVNRTFALQHEVLNPRSSIQQSLLRYAELSEGEKPNIVKLEPEFLVAPYFSFESQEDPWYKITVKLAQEARKQCKGKLFAPLCFSKELLLQEDMFNKIRDDFKDFDGYLVWASGFNDDKDAFEYLVGLAKFTKILAREKKPIYFMYGGLFVPILCRVLDIEAGYCRGICYGESKDVDQSMASGGGAPVRYYYGRTFSKLPESVARAFFTDNPKELCKCRVCSLFWRRAMRLPKNQRVPYFFDNLDYMSSRMHFMEIHASQIREVLRLSRKQAIVLLMKNIEHTRHFGPYNITNLHLARWHSALQQIMR
jgi:hypothetical protein